MSQHGNRYRNHIKERNTIMGKMTFRKQVESWMEQDGLPVTEKYVAPLFRLVMSDVEKRGMTLRAAYERELPNIEEKLKNEKVSTGKLHHLEAEATFFIQKHDDSIRFLVGETELDMTIKEAKQLIDILETVVNE